MSDLFSVVQCPLVLTRGAVLQSNIRTRKCCDLRMACLNLKNKEEEPELGQIRHEAVDSNI